MKVLIDRYQHDPVHHEVASDDRHRRGDDPPVRARPRARQGQGRRRHRRQRAPHDPLHPHQAQRRPARPRPAKEGVEAPPSTATCPSGAREGAEGLRRRHGSRCWWPPTSPPAASTSTTSRSSSTSTRPRTTRPTSTARAAPPGPAALLVVTLAALNEEPEVKAQGDRHRLPDRRDSPTIRPQGPHRLDPGDQGQADVPLITREGGVAQETLDPAPRREGGPRTRPAGEAGRRPRGASGRRDRGPRRPRPLPRWCQGAVPPAFFVGFRSDGGCRPRRRRMSSSPSRPG